ncbi:unnamed protein product, partial [Ilex paraguariensis]
MAEKSASLQLSETKNRTEDQNREKEKKSGKVLKGIDIMDWNLKTYSWDLPQFEQETIPNMDAISGSSSFVGQGIKGDFSIDLKLGQVADAGNELADNLKVPSVSQTALSASGSSKRPRGNGNGNQRASCLVDGCNADLSKCRDYHRRHKVCEHHTKTPQVTIRGQKQRFCQQCSRFHSLEEFDEGKRSCRKRLDGHNRRRRKPQPEPMSRLGSLMSNYPGSGYLSFSSAQSFPIAAASNPIWAGVVKAEQDSNLHNEHSQLHLSNSQNLFPEPSSSSNAGVGKQYSFLQATNLALGNPTTSEASIFINTVASSQNDGGRHKMLCDGLSTRFLHSDCALSLLSSPPTQSHSIPMAQPVDPGLNYNTLESMDSILVPNAGDVSIHYQGLFHTAPDVPSDNEAP